MESVQQDTNMKCGLLECPAFGTCEIWARTEGTIETMLDFDFCNFKCIVMNIVQLAIDISSTIIN
jgi:hypothetical protein